jgi:hypothetical protein
VRALEEGGDQAFYRTPLYLLVSLLVEGDQSYPVNSRWLGRSQEEVAEAASIHSADSLLAPQQVHIL